MRLIDLILVPAAIAFVVGLWMLSQPAALVGAGLVLAAAWWLLDEVE